MAVPPGDSAAAASLKGCYRGSEGRQPVMASAQYTDSVSRFRSRRPSSSRTAVRMDGEWSRSW